jgi:diaminopimelate decarboxylase
MRRDERGAVEIGGVSLPEIAAEFGTPVYVYDEETLRSTARAFRDAFARAYPRSRVVYAAKAFLATAIVEVLRDEGLGIDVVSGGELFVAMHAGMPASDITFHGNNKSATELDEAIEAGVGAIVIDNLYEIDLLESLLAHRRDPMPVMLRVNPGVDVHTHRKISTGLADSKFGLPIATGAAADAVARIADRPNLALIGYHAHVGSQLFEPDATVASIDTVLAFGQAMRDRHGIEMEHLSPGGGFAIAYVETDRPLGPATWAEIVATAVIDGCERRNLRLPILSVEPGRAIVGRAGVALYGIGAIKELEGIRTYVSVDGGMADNIRPALYDARYTAAIANRVPEEPLSKVTICGKYCESGDILIDEIELPNPVAGDLLAIPAAGAYSLSMASNYNLALRPPVVLVGDGKSRLIRRRETYDDLLATETGAKRHLTAASGSR